MMRVISRRLGGNALLAYFVVLFGFGLGISEVAAHSRLVKSDPPARAVLYGSQGVDAMVQRGGRTSTREGVDRAGARTADSFDQPWRQFRSASSYCHASG